MSTDPGNVSLGDFLQKLRASRHLGLTAAAQAARLHRSTLYRWEQGQALPRLTELEALLSALKADPSQKRRALLSLNAPRAQNQVREEIVRIGEYLGIGSIPSGGDLLRAIRMRQGLSLEAAAGKVQVTVRTLRRWEQVEAWPRAEQLHTLCYVIGAREEEVVALTVGRFAHGVGVQSVVSLESLQERFADICASRQGLMESQLMELSLLTLEAQLWPHGARAAAGRHLLARVYTEHAHVLSVQERFAEMGQYADKALDIAPEKSTGEGFWLAARIYSAAAVSCRRNASAVRQGIEQFRQLLPFAQIPEHECWILSWLGSLLVADGEAESGLSVFDLSCQVAALCKRPIELRMRENDKAQVLLTMKRPEEALQIITVEPTDNVFFRTGLVLEQAEAHLEMGHISEAHDHLQQAYSNISAHNLLHFRLHADKLARRL